MIAGQQLPPVVHLLSEPCLRAEPGKMLALVVGCWLLAAEPPRAHTPTPRASSVNPLGLAESATHEEQPGACPVPTTQEVEKERAPEPFPEQQQKNRRKKHLEKKESN